ncbi:MAG: protein kinase [Gammaproteobacteria bacterium]|nr:protein kinase [Gammaproteobacteria bacterium]
MRTLTEGMRLAGRYTLTRRLGVGGMAEVWLADDSQTRSQVALKCLNGESQADPRLKSLFNREWRIGSRLMHANIVRVFEFYDEPEGPYYSLQHLGDTDMSALAGAPPEDSLRPVGLIADALRYAHGKGVVHRDIKASNILLDSRGLPYLVDFGVAAAPGSDVITGGGSEISSSPQQSSGEPAVAADDVYALGVLIHELLTGSPPGAPGDKTGASLPGDPSPIPSAVQELLNDMLANNAERRPDAESVAARLAAAGYGAGPAPTRYVAGAGAMEEVVESVTASTAFTASSAAPNEPANLQGRSGGIPPKILYGGLATALALFLAVIFVLPHLVTPEAPEVGEASTVADESELSGSPVEGAADGDESGTDARPVAVTPGGSGASFNENVSGAQADDTARLKAATDNALGDLLSQLERLRYRAIDRWGGQEYLDAVDVYAEGDRAYLARNYELAGQQYRTASKMLAPFFDRIDEVFAQTLAAAIAAFEASDPSEAVRLFDLAVSITPGNRAAEAGLARATNLQAVLSLMDQGVRFEKDLELNAAKLAFDKALELDRLWEPAQIALVRIAAAIRQLSFEQRMTEGFEALAAEEFDSARAAFNAAKNLDSSSSQPTDGLLQVELEVRLADIRRLEYEASAHNAAEQWETSVTVYQDLLKIDPDLSFAQDGLSLARSRSALHSRLSTFISDPDTLSDQVTMRNATNLLLDVTRIQPLGPRLENQKNELSRLLKRAATPLPVQLVSDNLTSVAIFKIGQFGTFTDYDLGLLPGNYVAVGIRSGYRDVRVEFHVAPEVEMQPIVVMCEEQI